MDDTSSDSNVTSSSTSDEDLETGTVNLFPERAEKYARWLRGKVTALFRRREGTGYAGQRYVSAVLGLVVPVGLVLEILGFKGLKNIQKAGPDLLGSLMLLCLGVAWLVYLLATALAVRRLGRSGATESQQLKVTSSSRKASLTLVGAVAFLVAIPLLGSQLGISPDERDAVARGFGLGSILSALLIVELFRSIADTRLQCRLVSGELTEEKTLNDGYSSD